MISDNGVSRRDDARPSNPLNDGVRDIQSEAGGVIELAIVRPIDAPELIGFALASDADAVRLVRAIAETQSHIAAAPKRKPVLCASCPRPLRKHAHSVVLALPACDDPTKALCTAVCVGCATTRDEITAKAAKALRSIWPDLRQIVVTDRVGGRA